MMRPHMKHIESINIQGKEEAESEEEGKEVSESMLDQLRSFPHVLHIRIEGAVLTRTLLFRMSPSVKTLQLYQCRWLLLDPETARQSNMSWEPSGEELELESIDIIDCIYINYLFPLLNRNSNTKCYFPQLRRLKFNGMSVTQTCSVRNLILSHQLLQLEELVVSRVNPTIEPELLNRYFMHDLRITIAILGNYLENLRVFRAEERPITRYDIDTLCNPRLFPHLEELHLNACVGLTDDSLLRIPADTKLSLLNLQGCLNIRSAAVGDLRLRCANMRVIFTT